MEKGNGNMQQINAVYKISRELATVEDVFNQVYIADNYYKWFNMKPFVWIEFNKKYLDVGCTGRVFFTVPLFSYELTVIHVEKPNAIIFESRGKYFVGSAEMNIWEKDDQVLFEDPHLLRGKNKLIHNYYKWFLARNHAPYMNFRFKTLEGNIIRENIRRIENDNRVSISS